MSGTVTLLLLLVTVIGIEADPVADVSQDKESQQPDSVAAILSRMRPVREGELLLLQDQVQQRNTLLKERLQEAIANLKEMLKDGDTTLKEQFVAAVARLKEQLEEGDAHLKEQLKEGDTQLKEELAEDTAWLKDKLNKGETRMKEELAEGEEKTKEELQDLKDAFQNLRTAMKEWTQRNTALMDHLQQQMSQVQLQVNRSDISLQNTKDQLRSTQTELQVSQDSLQTTRDSLEMTQDKVKEQLRVTREQLQAEVQALAAVKSQLDTAQDQFRFLNVTMNTLQSSHGQNVSASLGLSGERDSYTRMGSTFVRWGCSSCPDNTSLVYSGVVGGSSYSHSGGASNYLCLVMDPQLDNMTLFKNTALLYGGEYHIFGQQQNDHDALCSVCRTLLATTIMVPATLTCPPGWTTQYQGHLMSGNHDHKQGVEYVCVDLIKESRVGGHVDDNGVLFNYVMTRCGSLPCPPYVNDKVVTCVVCSA